MVSVFAAETPPASSTRTRRAPALSAFAAGSVQVRGAVSAAFSASAGPSAAAQVLSASPDVVRPSTPRLTRAVALLARSERLFADDRSPAPGWPAMLMSHAAKVPEPALLSIWTVIDAPP